MPGSGSRDERITLTLPGRLWRTNGRPLEIELELRTEILVEPSAAAAAAAPTPYPMADAG